MYKFALLLVVTNVGSFFLGSVLLPIAPSSGMTESKAPLRFKAPPRGGNASNSTRCIPALDYVEVGTADIGTMLQVIESSRGPPPTLWDIKSSGERPSGVSVDAMDIYLDRLPTVDRNVKLNYAVSGYVPHDASVDVYYVKPEDIAKHHLPKWISQCNRVGAPHGAAGGTLANNGLLHLMQKKTVPLKSIQEILEESGACRMQAFKVDVEGLDSAVILGFVDFLWAHPHCFARFVRFEEKGAGASVESMRAGFAAAHAALSTVGYVVAVPPKGSRTPGDAVWEYDAARDARAWGHRAHLARALSKGGESARLVAAEVAAIEAAGGPTPARYLDEATLSILLAAGGKRSAFHSVLDGLLPETCLSPGPVGGHSLDFPDGKWFETIG